MLGGVVCLSLSGYLISPLAVKNGGDLFQIEYRLSWEGVSSTISNSGKENREWNGRALKGVFSMPNCRKRD